MPARLSTDHRADGAGAAWAPPVRQPRASLARTVLSLMFGFAVAAALLWFDRRGPALAVATITGAVLVLAVASPDRGFRALQGWLQAFGTLVGRALAWILLTPLFLFFFVPFGLLTRHGSRDPMRRRVDPEATTYWTERNDPPRDAAFFRRQF